MLGGKEEIKRLQVITRSDGVKMGKIELGEYLELSVVFDITDIAI